MGTAHWTDPAEQLNAEQRILSKAECDIEQGWTRLRNQQEMLSRLEVTGRDTREAERLMLLLERTLVEWERHRGLIEQRIAYLQKEVGRHLIRDV